MPIYSRRGAGTILCDYTFERASPTWLHIWPWVGSHYFPVKHNDGYSLLKIVPYKGEYSILFNVTHAYGYTLLPSMHRKLRTPYFAKGGQLFNMRAVTLTSVCFTQGWTTLLCSIHKWVSTVFLLHTWLGTLCLPTLYTRVDTLYFHFTRKSTTPFSCFTHV